MRFLKILFLCLFPAMGCFAALKPVTFNPTTSEIAQPQKAIFFEKNVRAFRQDVRLFIDTTPSPEDAYVVHSENRSYSQSNIFYYKDASGRSQRTVNATGATMTSYPVYYSDKYMVMRAWTDAEVKGIDKYGNLIYFTSTIGLKLADVRKLHPELIDETPTVYCWKNYTYNSAGGCWGAREKFTNFNSSIGATIGRYLAVSGIWIYPDYNSTTERAIPVYKATNSLDTTNYPKKGTGDNSSAANTAAGYKWVVWGKYLREIFQDGENTFVCWRQTTTTGEYFCSEKLWRPVRLEGYGDFKEVK